MTTPRPDPTRNERQARFRAARREWLKRHGFKSPEALITALMADLPGTIDILKKREAARKETVKK